MIVKDIMCPDLLVVTPDMLVSELGLFLTGHAISGAPVMEDGKLVGVVSLRDIAANPCNAALEPATHRPGRPDYFRDLYMEEEEARGFVIEDLGTARVRDIMTPAVYTIHASASLQTLVDLMMRAGIHRVIVTDDEGQPSGIVTTTDLMRLIPLLLPQGALAPSP